MDVKRPDVWPVLEQPLHRTVQTLLEVYKGIGRPQLFLQFLPSNGLTRALQEHICVCTLRAISFAPIWRKSTFILARAIRGLPLVMDRTKVGEESYLVAARCLDARQDRKTRALQASR
jgi:hypothetical protein